jgi:hypothetical protein
MWRQCNNYLSEKAVFTINSFPPLSGVVQENENEKKDFNLLLPLQRDVSISARLVYISMHSLNISETKKSKNIQKFEN